MTLADCTVSGNTSTGGGGVNNTATATLIGCTLSGNSANSGGGLSESGSTDHLTMTDCTVSGNKATSGPGGGIATGSFGTVALNDCTISGNRASGFGGGFWDYVTHSTLTNCTITGNSSASSGGGLATRLGSVRLTDSTVSGNSASYAGGFYSQKNIPGHTYAGTLSLANTIVSGNSATTVPDIGGLINTDSGHNLLGAALLGTTSGPGDVFTDAPRLQPLGDHGGPTQTTPPLPGSPALGAGSATLSIDPNSGLALTTDQRGAPRVNGTSIDIGAVESEIYLVTTTSDTPLAGQTTLRQAITGANLFTDSFILFAIPGGGPHIISPTSALPPIVFGVSIEGSSQPGYSGSPLIQIAGSPGDGDGLTLSAGSDGSVIQGLDISGVHTSGAAIQVLSNGDLIQGDYLGTDLTGSLAAGNGYGVSIQGNSSTIGGTDVASRNLISGNLLGGVVIATGSGNVVEGNLIGADVTGVNAIGNAQFGIQISNAPNNTVGGSASGAGNTIVGTQVLAGSPNSGWGIEVVGAGSSGSVIQGDVIGEVQGLGNAGVGIADDLATILIGGVLAGQSNVIGFNGGAGISLASVGAADSRVRQNRIVGNAGGGIAVAASGAAHQPPVLTGASIVGNLLKVRGAAVPGALLEFYVSTTGQGSVFIGSATEGSQTDNDPAAGTFNFAIPIPASVGAAAGVSITALSVATPVSPTNPALQDTASPFAPEVVSDSGPAFGAPVVSAGGGGTIVAGATFASQGAFTDTTSLSWTATVNYGDGTGTHALTINPVSIDTGSGDDYSRVASATFNLSHVFAGAGTYSVVVSVTNDSGLTGTSGFNVTVAAAPPTVNNTDIHIAPSAHPTITTSPAIISENQSVILTGKFADANPGATHTVSIIWGDNQTSAATINEAAGTFSATHTYLSPGTINSASGIYTVEVNVNSSVGTKSLDDRRPLLRPGQRRRPQQPHADDHPDERDDRRRGHDRPLGDVPGAGAARFARRHDRLGRPLADHDGRPHRRRAQLLLDPPLSRLRPGRRGTPTRSASR